MDAMRRHFLAFALMAGAIACGGATEQDVLSASSSGSASSSSSSSSSSASSSSGGSSPGGSSSGDTGGPKDPPSPSCTQESEPNDAPRSANELVTSVCGVLDPASEVDFLTFELPEGTKTMGLGFEGDIKMRVFVEGHDTVEISPKENPPVPFVIGTPYYIQIRAFSGGDTTTWRVTLNRT